MEFFEERRRDFRQRLMRWYQTHRRKLPWRETHDPYKIWISEIMLQQTTVSAVIPYYTKWIRIFPDLETLSKAPLQKVLKAWEGLGYYQRAKNLHKTAQIIHQRFEGRFPQDCESLGRLPGLGPYTAAALLSFAFNKPYPVVDANVRRVMMRVLRIQHKVDAKVDRNIKPVLKLSLPARNSAHFNQALMELGALVCRPKNPLCLLCPITDFCGAFEAGEQEIIPLPKKRSYQRIETVIAIIKKGNKFLIQKRPSEGLLADLWEFPGGKRKEDESLRDALHREIREELDTDIKEEKLLTRVHHSYTQFQVTLYAYACRTKNPPCLKRRVHRWVSLRAMRHYPFPSGNAKIVRFLEASKGNLK